MWPRVTQKDQLISTTQSYCVFLVVDDSAVTGSLLYLFHWGPIRFCHFQLQDHVCRFSFAQTTSLHDHALSFSRSHCPPIFPVSFSYSIIHPNPNLSPIKYHIPLIPRLHSSFPFCYRSMCPCCRLPFSCHLSDTSSWLFQSRISVHGDETPVLFLQPSVLCFFVPPAVLTPVFDLLSPTVQNLFVSDFSSHDVILRDFNVHDIEWLTHGVRGWTIRGGQQSVPTNWPGARISDRSADRADALDPILISVPLSLPKNKSVSSFIRHVIFLHTWTAQDFPAIAAHSFPSLTTALRKLGSSVR